MCVSIHLSNLYGFYKNTLNMPNTWNVRIFFKVDVIDESNATIRSYLNTHIKLVVVDYKSIHITLTKLLLFMAKYHMYRVLVGVFPNISPPGWSQITFDRSLLTS